MSTLWPWLVVAGLGIFHGLNPAMGWLFAVAIGLHRKSQLAVVASLLPIAIGHAVSIAAVVLMFWAFSTTVDEAALRVACGAILIVWAFYHWVYGHGRRVRVGMQASMLGLGIWSFMMATAHGAGLMLIPVLIPLCLADIPAKELAMSGSLVISTMAVALHTIAMLLVTGTIALVVYRWLGLAFLRLAWINIDWLWSAALAAAGVILVIN